MHRWTVITHDFVAFGDLRAWLQPIVAAAKSSGYPLVLSLNGTVGNMLAPGEERWSLRVEGPVELFVNVPDPV